MSKQETQQRTIFGEPLEETLSLETTGRTIRPFKRVIDQIADEYRLTFNDDGIHVDVVDTANVQMLSLTLHADALNTYEITEETTLGVNSRLLGSALQHARYGKTTDDPVTITAGANHLQTETNRELGDTEATINERVELIDPDGIRASPDIPALETDVEVDVDPRAFCEIASILEDNEPLRLGSDTDSIVFNQDGDLNQRNIELDADPDDVTEWTYYSVDYIKDWMNAFENGYVDELSLSWAQEYPLMAEFSREGVMSGMMCVAPRIQSE